jgi:hypothetical protein
MRALKRIAAPLHALAPLEALLVADGDVRLGLDGASGLNPYGCRPAPRPEAINLSSSTASSISERAFRRAQEVRRALGDGGPAAFEAINEAARAELAQLLGIGATGAEIVFAPSGTDAQLLALAVARMVEAGPLVSILAAADETGSGAPNATSGRHFSHTTASGRAVTPGAPVAGLGEGVTSIAVRLRDGAGALRPAAALDRAVLAVVRRCASAGGRAILYAMDHSKLGNSCPSEACLAEIEAGFGASVQIVVDACQMRLGRGRIQAHLERGRMVLITGSKFFAGPPLSGALLVPPLLAAHLAAARAVPEGLRDYTIAADWPSAWRGVRAGLERRTRMGPLLRWSAALAEMEAFHAVPAGRRRLALAAFAAAVPRAMACFEEFSLLPEATGPAVADDEFPVRTIFPFVVRDAGGLVSFARSAKLYRALNRDVGGLLPATLGPEERRLAALCCHIGQPVALAGSAGSCGALRVSASAAILDAAEPPEPMLRQVFAKLRLLLGHFAVVEAAF